MAGSPAILEPDWTVPGRRRPRPKRARPTGLEVASAGSYASRTRWRGRLGTDWDRMQDLVEGVKRGDRTATREAAVLMAELVSTSDRPTVVVPAPRSSEDRPSLLPLAQAIAKLIGARAVCGLERRGQVPSSRLLRRQGRSGLTEAHHHATIRVARYVHSEARIILIDDVVTEGSTLLACTQVLIDGGHVGPIMGLTLASTVLEPEAVIDPFEPVWRTLER